MFRYNFNNILDNEHPRATFIKIKNIFNTKRSAI